MKIASWLIPLLLLFASAALAAPENMRDAQIDAATMDAIGRLRAEIEVQQLSPGLNVGGFLRQTAGDDDLIAALRRAEQIGGPRWIDSETCQVKLAIASERVRET